jgi:hypothetical protein
MKKLFVMMFALLLLVVFTTPAMSKVEIGGIIFTDFYYLNRDKENAADWKLGNGTSSYNVTKIQVPNISRLNVRWTNEDNVGMYIELGVGQDSRSSDHDSISGVELRHAYGWWNINPDLKLTAGKTTTPFSPLNPSQLLGTRSGSDNIIGTGFGNLYSCRVAQVRGTYEFNKNIRIALALVDPNAVADVVYDKGPWDWEDEYSSKIPRVDIGVPLSFSCLNLYPSLMWQTRTVDKVEMTGDKIITYIGSLGFKAGYGSFVFSGEGNWGKNWGNTAGYMGYTYPAMFSSAGYRDGEVNDTETYSFWLDLAYKIGIATPHLIYGEMRTKNAYLEMDFDSKSKMYGVSCPIQLAKGFSIRPEVMFYDEGVVKVTGNEDYLAGKYMIAGVQFQIAF